MASYFRIHSEDEDPERLLDPDAQVSEPWGGADLGPCDKCGGSGQTEHECDSCRETADPSCPACRGSVRWNDRCPACNGTGEISDERREGVSVFPSEEGLYRYMIRRRGHLDGCRLVELEGEPTGDDDFDADEGALLVRPTRIVDVREPDRELAERVGRDVGAKAA